MASRQDFVAFIRKVGIYPACEACGRNDWLVPEEGGGLFVGVVLHNPGTPMNLPPTMIPALTMICKNCGNVRLHSSGVVDAAMREGGDNV